MNPNVAAVGINVLGPVEARVRGTRAALGGRRPKAVLVALLLAHGGLVGEDQIIDAVWEDQPPDKPRQTLHTYVADLRRALEPQRRAREQSTVLVRHAAGYALAVEPEAVDTHRFTALVGQAAAAAGAERPAEALACADRALALWAGPPFAELADARFVRAEISRLEEWRSLARELRVAACLALGDHRLTLVETEALTTDYPLRESGWALRTLALYRCGRQAEALATLRAARRVLREELGVDPGPDLATLTGRVLAHDPALRWQA
ncbi:DNA-binding SARP family transcriptional activator [Kitasatospora sp. MAP12-15]|uniref:AfsR/SARP family transcriptional regulator n=1 Tax=unclassified Kitasatospora TaxID=2633591 RepID=UPI002474AA35|nr:AfsR/SARP family transcriptional regulator [Kitasatospora sp. MAP12-44]MDH6110516.1 DNA-binding SARP family transcriptional activator [Kitasatospora sp. MAP12-44]